MANVRYCAKSGAAQGAEVVYRPRSEDDRCPWEVDSRWYSQYNGWRLEPSMVTTMERYRANREARLRPTTAR